MTRTLCLRRSSPGREQLDAGSASDVLHRTGVIPRYVRLKANEMLRQRRRRSGTDCLALVLLALVLRERLRRLGAPSTVRQS